MRGVFLKCEFQQNCGTPNTNWRAVFSSPPPQQGGGRVGLDFKAMACKGVSLCAMPSASEVFISSPLPWPAGCSPLLQRLDNGAMDAHAILSRLSCSAHPEFMDRQSLAFALTTLNLRSSSTPGSLLMVARQPEQAVPGGSLELTRG